MKRFVLPVLFLAASFALPQSSSEVEITAEGHHHVAFENEFVRVFKVEVAPKDSTLMHRHRHDYLFVTIGDSDVSNEVEGKPPAELRLKDGETRFTPGNFAHIAHNLAPTAFRNVTIEFLQDEKARNSPAPKWDEERGLQVLNSGTQEILFVKDGARVSEIELQPLGNIPSHSHKGPHLVVAVTDLDLRSDVQGRSPMQLQLKSGDAKWVPGGYTHTLTNVGKGPAKFVTVEFP